MGENVSMFINVSTNETRNDLDHHCRISSRNDPIPEPADLPPAEDELPAVHAGERHLGNTVRQALITQHFT